MKVIKRVPWSLKYTCTGCKSELEIEPSDVLVGRFGCFDDYETRYYVKCTVCGTEKYLNEKNVPTNVLRDARKEGDDGR